MTSARPPPQCACIEVVREPFACVSGAAGCVNVNRGPLVLRDGNPCGCLCVSFELTHLVLQFLFRTIHFEKSTPGTPTDLRLSEPSASETVALLCLDGFAARQTLRHRSYAHEL